MIHTITAEELDGEHKFKLAYSSAERKSLEVVFIISGGETETFFFVTTPKFSHKSKSIKLSVDTYNSLKTVCK